MRYGTLCIENVRGEQRSQSVGVGGYDETTGLMEVFVDTDAPNRPEVGRARLHVGQSGF